MASITYDKKYIVVANIFVQAIWTSGEAGLISPSNAYCCVADPQRGGVLRIPIGSKMPGTRSFKPPNFWTRTSHAPSTDLLAFPEADLAGRTNRRPGHCSFSSRPSPSTTNPSPGQILSQIKDNVQSTTSGSSLSLAQVSEGMRAFAIRVRPVPWRLESPLEAIDP